VDTSFGDSIQSNVRVPGYSFGVRGSRGHERSFDEILSVGGGGPEASKPTGWGGEGGWLRDCGDEISGQKIAPVDGPVTLGEQSQMCVLGKLGVDFSPCLGSNRYDC
jgi:hypothetical protein